MSYGTLIQHWMGETPAEITANWQPPARPEGFDGVLASQYKHLTAGVLKGIIKRAEDGDLDAVAWLEGRGLVALPTGDASG